MERKLATIRKVKTTEPIAGADKIETARIDGWQCVVKKGTFTPGAYGVFFEIDSVIPMNKWSAFLFDANAGTGSVIRIKTKRLRGTLSQGLFLPLTDFETDIAAQFVPGEPERDYTDLLGVTLYLPPVSTNLVTDMVRPVPPFIRKTDEERIQNLDFALLQETYANQPWYVTEKIDGTSGLYFYNPAEDTPENRAAGIGAFGICSRNFQLKTFDIGKRAVYHDNADIYGIEQKLTAYFQKTQRVLSVHGEIYGPGINKNMLRINEVSFAVFSIFDITAQKYVPLAEMETLCAELTLPMVPRIAGDFLLNTMTFDEILALADGTTSISFHASAKNKPLREGIVFRLIDTKQNEGKVSFKVLSNNYLLKTGE